MMELLVLETDSMKRLFRQGLFKRLGIWIALVFSVVFMASPVIASEISTAPENAKAYLIEPHDGQTVAGEFLAKFGLSGMGVAPAGVDAQNTGHHHLLIDLETLPDLSQPLAASDQIKHFGGGQTETTLSLPPGSHTLQLLLGNYQHIPHDHPVLSEKIQINVRA